MNGDKNDDGRGAVRYGTKTVQAVRGTVVKTVASWEEQGWEVVSRSEGLVRTEITLRRAKRAVDVRRYAIVGAGVAVVVGAFVAVGILAGGRSDDETTARPAARASAADSSSPSPAALPATSSATPTVTATAPRTTGRSRRSMPGQAPLFDVG